jgi:hypothetical protein
MDRYQYYPGYGLSYSLGFSLGYGLADSVSDDYVHIDRLANFHSHTFCHADTDHYGNFHNNADSGINKHSAVLCERGFLRTSGAPAR